jgi:hypothetical protein
MAMSLKSLLSVSILTAPLVAFGGPPASHPGNGGHGPANPGANAGNPHGQGQGNSGRGQGSGGGDRDESGDERAHGSPPGIHAQGNEGAGNGPEPGVARGNPQGNSQGALHANYHAIAAVCRNRAAATHSALGVDCGGGVVVAVDPRTGVASYSQAGLVNSTTASDEELIREAHSTHVGSPDPKRPPN